MNLADAERLARELMDAHGLTTEPPWRFRFDRARRRAGSCSYSPPTLTLSAVLIPLYPPDAVRGVILHEIAHALVGPSHGHDEVWQWVARHIGAPDRARLPASMPAPTAPWVGVCPRCGAERRLFSAPRRVASCGVCARVFRPELVYQWSFRGVPQVPGGAYAREFVRLVPSVGDEGDAAAS